MSSGPAGTDIRLKSFSDRDFLYVSRAFLHALIVAGSPALRDGEDERLSGDCPGLLGDGTRLVTGLVGAHDGENVAVAQSR